MDSITQAALGAAMGEAVLGKKMGNRALLWGAVAGTIPDLDVLSRLFIDNELYGLIYHRGLTHSILFTVLAPFLFAWLAQGYYNKGLHKKPLVQWLWFGLWLVFYGAILIALSYVVVQISQHPILIGLTAVLWVCLYFLIKALFVSKEKANNFESTSTYGEWYLMFFLAILTHWLIDACTAYGTQIFEPFSSYRVTFNNITIVDPLYTVPLLIGIAGAYWARNNSQRRLWNGYIGIGISSLYMAFSFYAKHIVNKVVESNLEAKQIKYTTYMTTPTILNTILWQTIVETPDSFYYGMYSLLDKTPNMELMSLPKNQDLIQPYADDEFVKILLWFAQGYYNVTPLEEGKIQFNNLRFGLAATSPNAKDVRYIMWYEIGKDEQGKVTIHERRLRNEEMKMGDMFSALWTRLKGI